MRTPRFLLLICLLLAPTLPVAAGLRVQDGDLLFVTAATTGLSGAINDATAKPGTISFDHVGLIAHDTHGQIVLHADEKGSREQTLTEFIEQARAKHRHVVVYRLKPDLRTAIPDAIAKARTLLGKPYNYTYVQAEDSYYCSDFIERAFRTHQVFAVEPMNFKNPQTGKISQYWIDFYRGKGMQVPQDKPGTNPNDMAASPALQRIGTLD